jgi:ribosomal protein S9
MFPFKVVDRINKFNMDIEINKGGMSCLAKGIRFAISKALCSFVTADSIEKLRLGSVLFFLLIFSVLY